MSTNGENITEDTEMSDCDGEKVVTMMDVLQEQQEFEEDANAVLGASDDKNCTYAKGYVKRQALYACLTCCHEAKEDPSKWAGVCLACSLNCHENHELIELYTKRNFKCDCGNPKFNNNPCQFNPDKTTLNEGNSYNQNFAGLYCVCHRPYPDPESANEDDMIQCIICEDWLHASHLEAAVPPNDQYSEMICKSCMENYNFLQDYVEIAVNIEAEDVDVVNVNDNMANNAESDIEMLKNGTADLPDKQNHCNVGTTDPCVEIDTEKTVVFDKMKSQEDNIVEHTEEIKHVGIEKECSKNDEPMETETNTPLSTDTIAHDRLLDTESNEQDKQLDTEVNKQGKQIETEANEQDKQLEKETNDQNKQLNTEVDKEDKQLDTEVNQQDKELETEINEKGKQLHTEIDEQDKPSESQINEQDKPLEIDITQQDLESTSCQHDKLLDMGTTEQDKLIEANVNEQNEAIKPIDNKPSESLEHEQNEPTSLTEDSTIDAKLQDKETTDEAAENEKTDAVMDAIDELLEENTKTSIVTNGTLHNQSTVSENTTNTESNENHVLTESDMTNIESADKFNGSNATDHLNLPKRKLSIEGMEDNLMKKPKLEGGMPCSRPKNVKKKYKGAVFWPSNFRQKLCACGECILMYKDLNVLYLTDDEDTVSFYESVGKANGSAGTTQYEKGLEALSSLDRIQQINALTEYNKMRDKLLDFLKSFKDRKEIVKEEDIKAFFAGMKPRREQDGVYFCR